MSWYLDTTLALPHNDNAMWHVSHDNTVRECSLGLYADSQDFSYIGNKMFILQSLNIVR